MMMLLLFYALISPAVNDFLSFATRVSTHPVSQHTCENALTKLTGFLRYYDIHVSLEYAERTALVHIYRSLPCSGAPFLVSLISGVVCNAR